MTLEEFSAAVAASMCNEQWVLTPVPVLEEAIAEAEVLLGVRFPDDYRHVLRTYGAGDFHYVELLAPVLGGGGCLVKVNQDLRSSGVSHFLAISPDGCGDYYGFRVVGGKCAPEVYFWDHEEEALSGKSVADSVLHFLRDNALVLPTDLHLVATGREHLVNRWWWW